MRSCVYQPLENAVYHKQGCRLNRMINISKYGSYLCFFACVAMSPLLPTWTLGTGDSAMRCANAGNQVGCLKVSLSRSSGDNKSSAAGFVAVENGWYWCQGVQGPIADGTKGRDNSTRTGSSSAIVVVGLLRSRTDGSTIVEGYGRGSRAEDIATTTVRL